MDYIVIDGDAAVFEDQFGAAMIEVQDGTMVGSGFASVDGAAVCIEADIAAVIVGPVPYSTSSHSQKGAGLLIIDSLADDQLATQTTTNGEAVILVGSKFNAKFQVAVPAIQPGSPPQPDLTPDYAGYGVFDSQNDLVRGT